MRILSKILLILILSFWAFSLNTNAWFFSDLLWDSEVKVDIWVDCWEEWQQWCIDTWVEKVKDTVNWIETERTLSDYIQSVVAYLLTFLSIIAVLYIIYAWFRILTGAWDEETLKKQKTTILYVIIWIAIIWLAYPITKFIINLFSNSTV